MGGGTDYAPASIVAGAELDDGPNTGGRGAGVQLLLGMLAMGGIGKPSAIADLIARHPEDQRDMIALLQKTVGNGATHAVVELMLARGAPIVLPPPLLPPNKTGVGLADNLTLGERDGGELGPPGGGNLHREHSIREVQDRITDAGKAADTAALRLRMDELTAPPQTDHVGFFVGLGLSILSKYLGSVVDGVKEAGAEAAERASLGIAGKATSALGGAIAEKLLDAGGDMVKDAPAASAEASERDERSDKVKQLDTIADRLRDAYIGLRTSALDDASDADIKRLLQAFDKVNHTADIYEKLIDDKLKRFRASGILNTPDWRDGGWMDAPGGERVRTGIGHQHEGISGTAATRSVARVHFMSGAPPRYGYRLAAHISASELDTPTHKPDELAVRWVHSLAAAPEGSTPIHDRSPDPVDVIDSWVPPEFETEAVQAHQRTFGTDPSDVLIDDSDPMRYGVGRAYAATRNKLAIADGNIAGIVSWPVGAPTIKDAPREP